MTLDSKAAVEAGFRFAQSYILGPLRIMTFFSLAEANAAVTAAVERMNSREMRRFGMSHRQLFKVIERPAGLLNRPRWPLSRGFGPTVYPAKRLVSYQTYRQLSGWNLLPRMLRAIGRTEYDGLGHRVEATLGFFVEHERR
ncbi:MAG: hypothetical protein ACRYF2_07855 [Janthinobacterium lividum]